MGQVRGHAAVEEGGVRLEVLRWEPADPEARHDRPVLVEVTAPAWWPEPVRLRLVDGVAASLAAVLAPPGVESTREPQAAVFDGSVRGPRPHRVTFDEAEGAFSRERVLRDGMEERIAHLRTGLELAQEDLTGVRRQLGWGPSRVIPMLLSKDTERAVELDRALESTPPAVPLRRGQSIDVRIDGPPGAEAGRFVEVEDSATGASISIGQWIEQPNGHWLLRIAFESEGGA